jgi:hypothetical protein
MPRCSFSPVFPLSYHILLHPFVAFPSGRAINISAASYNQHPFFSRHHFLRISSCPFDTSCTHLRFEAYCLRLADLHSHLHTGKTNSQKKGIKMFILLIVLLSLAGALVDAQTGTGQLDILFPRPNETYKRVYPFPVVFALHNPAALWPYGFKYTCN